MTIQQLEYILAVDKFRHFAKAASYCNITQPTLSAMIQKLEDELGIRIFDRSVQPVCPTAIGQKILVQAKLVLSQATRIKDIVEEEQHSLRNTFKLAVLPTIAPYLLPRFFPQMLEKYPEMDIRVTERKTKDIKAAILNSEIDAAIIADIPQEEYLTGEVLFYEEFFGYVSPNESIFKNNVIRTSDVDGKHLWLLDEGHCFRDQLIRFCRMENVKVNQAAYQLGSMETFMRMVEGGNGTTFIPELAVLQLNETQKTLVRPFAIPRPTRAVTLVTNKHFIRNIIRQLIIDQIQTAVPKSMLSLSPMQQLV